MLADLHEPLEPALVIDGACDPDRLVRRAEVGVAAHLHGNVTAQAAQRCEILARGGFGQLPPDMQLDRAFRRAAAALHHKCRDPKIADQMGELGKYVASIEVDHYGLHLDDFVGARLTLRCHGAGTDIERRTLAPRPGGEGLQLVEG